MKPLASRPILTPVSGGWLGVTALPICCIGTESTGSSCPRTRSTLVRPHPSHHINHIHSPIPPIRCLRSLIEVHLHLHPTHLITSITSTHPTHPSHPPIPSTHPPVSPTVRTGPGLVIKGVYRLLVDSPASAAAAFRPQMDELYTPPVLAFTPLPGSAAQWAAAHVTNYSGMVGMRCEAPLSPLPAPAMLTPPHLLARSLVCVTNRLTFIALLSFCFQSNPAGLPVNVNLITMDLLSGVCCFESDCDCLVCACASLMTIWCVRVPSCVASIHF
jgi:hypothetical protein